MSSSRASCSLMALIVLTLVMASCKGATEICDDPVCALGDVETLRPSDSCADFSPTDIATFLDENLEAAVRTALALTAPDDLTCALVSQPTQLEAVSAGIASLSGIQNLVRLQILKLGFNQIVDLSPISGLVGLQRLEVFGNNVADIGALSGLVGLDALLISGNRISDISPLEGLTNLRDLITDVNQISNLEPLRNLLSLEMITLDRNLISDLDPLSGLTNTRVLIVSDNSVTDVSALAGLSKLTELNLRTNPSLADIQPLLDNTGLGAGDLVDLSSTGVACSDVSALAAKGVTVTSDCP